ncbi:MAG: anhydro-N-acetylmuramic acid kinase [Cyclobacteriaceae bacterium]
MTKNTYHVAGLMSGTSLDGLDIAFCTFEYKNEKWSFKLQASKSVSYDEPLRNRLKDSISDSALDLLILNNFYGDWLGQQVSQFVKENKIEVDFIASHGHTVLHQPEKGITYQIGSGQHLANACGIKTICDFRSKDVAVNGQGAPLVPIGDKYLFPEYDVCLNLGGISNISFELNGKRLAYDIGLANMVLNYLANQRGLPYDKNGTIAKSGEPNKNLLDQLNNLDYYQKPYPKSTGYEWFRDEVLPIIDSSGDTIENKLCTAVHHVTFQIAKDVRKIAGTGAKMLVTGGGALNSFLIETLGFYLDGGVEIVVPDNSIIEFKEAIVFAFMGVLRERNEINCLRAVTGAGVDTSGGVIYYPAVNLRSYPS